MHKYLLMAVLGIGSLCLLGATASDARADWPTSYYYSPAYSSYYYPPVVSYPAYTYPAPAPVYRSYYYPTYTYPAPAYSYPAPTVNYYNVYPSYYYRAPVLRPWRTWY